MATIVRAGRAAKQARNASIVKSSKPPKLGAVYAAVHAGKIEHEEAKDLNPKYTPEKQYGKLVFGPKANKKGSKYTQGMHYRVHTEGAAALTPSSTDIHSAVEGGHITKEEGLALNKNYKPDVGKNAVHYRKMEKARRIQASGEGKTPSLVNVHRAVRQGHISSEEATSLNSKYEPNNKAQLKELTSNMGKQDRGYYRNWEKNKNHNVGKQFSSIAGDMEVRHA
jgi:hypothetical protein